MRQQITAWLFLCFAVSAQAGDCTSSGGIQPFCSVSRPEDLVAIPGSDLLIVSQYGGFEKTPGSLVLFDANTHKQQQLYPATTNPTGKTAKNDTWGHKGCQEPAVFSPHGIDLVKRNTGEMELLAVNHGERESIELFSVSQQGDNASLQWRGCVEVGTGALNDVAGLPDGSFITTSTDFNKSEKTLTGYVFSWSAEKRLSPLTVYQGELTNGIAVSPDGLSAFVNLSLSNRVNKISMDNGNVIASASVISPDNSSWSKDGQLLVASVRHSSVEQIKKCNQERNDFCNVPFAIVAIDPDTMKEKILFSHAGGPPFGGATVAVQLKDDLYLGSFAGDRMAKIKMPAAGRADNQERQATRTQTPPR